MKFGVNVTQVYRYTYENIPAQEVKLLLKILSKIKFFGQGRIVTFQIDQQPPRGKKTGMDLADQVLSFGRATPQPKAPAADNKTTSTTEQPRPFIFTPTRESARCSREKTFL